MKLRSLRLINYRCWEDSGDIPLTDFCVFIGRNDGGKSSALEAIVAFLTKRQLADGDHHSPDLDAEGGSASREPLEVRLTVEDERNIHTLRYVRMLGQPGVWEIEGACVGHDGLDGEMEGYSLPQLQALATELLVEVTGPRNRRESFLQPLLVHRASLPTVQAWKPCPSAVLQRMPKCYHYGEQTDPNPETAIQQFAMSYYNNELKPSVASETENVRETIQQKLDAKAREMVPVLKEHCDGVADVILPINPNSFSTLQLDRVRVVKTNGVEVDWSRIGRGKRREMALAVFRWQSDILTSVLEATGDEGLPIVALFDEPDMNLDYESQRRVTEALRKLSAFEEAQVIVATHSINLIDSVSVFDLLFFGQSPRCPVRRVRVDATERDVVDSLMDAVGLRNSMLFNERVFVVCSGQTEHAAFPLLFRYVIRKTLSTCGVCLLRGESDETALQMAALLRKNGRGVLLVVDRDVDASPHVRARFETNRLKHTHGLGPECVVKLGHREFEDVFSDEVWADTLNCPANALAKPDGRDPWTPEEIASFRDEPKFSKALIDAIRNEVPRSIGKPRLGVLVAKQAIATCQVPQELVDLMQRIAGAAGETEPTPPITAEVAVA